MPDEPEEPERPHVDASMNGAGHHFPKARRTHAPWEFLILALLVALVGVGIILGWTLVGSHSPERLDDASAAAVAGTCDRAQSALKALANPDPVLGADRVARLRAENAIFTTMVAQLHDVRPEKSTPANALTGWSGDWQRMIDARVKYANDLQGTETTGGKIRFITPAATGGIKPITDKMDDFVRENHPRIDACFTAALQIEKVEGKREYKKVTS